MVQGFFLILFEAPMDFFWFCFLPPFDLPCRLKSGVTPPPPPPAPENWVPKKSCYVYNSSTCICSREAVNLTKSTTVVIRQLNVTSAQNKKRLSYHVKNYANLEGYYRPKIRLDLQNSSHQIPPHSIITTFWVPSRMVIT